MIAIIDYKAGNLRSVERALNKLGYSCCITQEKRVVARAERVVFPGVGAAGKAISDLKELGLDEVLHDAFLKGKPIIGICLGAQIILEKSEENNAVCLGLLKGNVRHFPEPLYGGEVRLKIPHMGWNRVEFKRSHPIFEGIRKEDEFYFVHSYYPLPAMDRCVVGLTEYGICFPSVIGFRNLVATQFHPEKSGDAGAAVLSNWVEGL